MPGVPAGNRENMPPLTGWHGRIDQATKNLSDNLIIFVILALVAHAAGKTNDVTASASIVFYGARVAHALCYVGGITVYRTIAFNIGVVALGVLFLQLF